VSCLSVDTAPASLIGGQPNFARCLAVSWAGRLCIHFRGSLPPNGILPAAKFTFRPSFALSYIGSVTARHSSSGRRLTLQRGTRNGVTYLSQRAPPVFGRAAITLGVGPHSSFYRASYASAVLGVVILCVCLSVRLSVRLSHACFATNPKNRPAIFLYHTKGQSFWFSDAKDLSEIQTGSPPTGSPNRGGVG